MLEKRAGTGHKKGKRKVQSIDVLFLESWERDKPANREQKRMDYDFYFWKYTD